ncbi:hypothetical protein PLICRDRAFT_699950 [Plicaturopsis crispa FD-325 SS-3]|nr:hypothetical protein PLICRDRAFT_699950 [Plicaturopsis crispa FD-325 SS-3]
MPLSRTCEESLWLQYPRLASRFPQKAQTRPRQSTRLAATGTKRSPSPDDLGEYRPKRAKKPPATRETEYVKEEDTAENDPDVWPATEFVVLQAKNVRFKFLKSRLAEESVSSRHSHYKISGVSSADLKDLLKALDGAIMFMPTNDYPNNSLACMILRAAHQLEFHNYRAAMVRTLESRFNSSTFQQRPTHAAEVLHTARAYGVPQVVQRAAYELVRTKGFKSLDSLKDVRPFLRRRCCAQAIYSCLQKSASTSIARGLRLSRRIRPSRTVPSGAHLGATTLWCGRDNAERPTG